MRLSYWLRSTYSLKACSWYAHVCTYTFTEAGANVNFQRSPGPTMLLAAVSVGSTDIVNFLLEAGADPNVHDGVLN
jgi:ankyrin repeat protein